MIIIHHINEEEYREAIDNLKHVKDEIVNDLLYRYCHIFMKHEPGRFYYFHEIKFFKFNFKKN